MSLIGEQLSSQPRPRPTKRQPLASKRSTNRLSSYRSILITSRRLFVNREEKVEPVALQEQDGDFDVEELNTSTHALFDDSDGESVHSEVSA